MEKFEQATVEQIQRLLRIIDYMELNPSKHYEFNLNFFLSWVDGWTTTGRSTEETLNYWENIIFLNSIGKGGYGI
jgi:hypothetical protein